MATYVLIYKDATATNVYGPFNTVRECNDWINKVFKPEFHNRFTLKAMINPYPTADAEI